MPAAAERYHLGRGAQDKELRELIGWKLRQARKAAKLTLAGVAEATGVAEQTIVHWEIGRSFPSPEKLVALSDLYGISLDWLLGKEVNLRLLKEAAAEYAAGGAWDEFTEPERLALQEVIAAFAERARRRKGGE